MKQPEVGSIEVFADVCCPFTHVGLRRFSARRRVEAREDVRLRVRAWPLEIVNGEPLDSHHIAEEVEELRIQVAPDLFAGFDERAFPSTSLPAMALVASAYEESLELGEQASFELRDRLFERGQDISERSVLREVARSLGLANSTGDLDAVMADHVEGRERGVIGSPHFFTNHGSYFCPALDISRDGDGRLHIAIDPVAFEHFLTSCFRAPG